MDHSDEQVLLVHPDDVNLADVKALAARHGVSAEGSAFVPRGQAFLANLPESAIHPRFRPKQP